LNEDIKLMDYRNNKISRHISSKLLFIKHLILEEMHSQKLSCYLNINDNGLLVLLEEKMSVLN